MRTWTVQDRDPRYPSFDPKGYRKIEVVSYDEVNYQRLRVREAIRAAQADVQVALGLFRLNQAKALNGGVRNEKTDQLTEDRLSLVIDQLHQLLLTEYGVEMARGTDGP